MAKEPLNKGREFKIPVYDNAFACGHTISHTLREHANAICDTQGMALPTEKILFLYDKRDYRGGPMSYVIPLSAITKELVYQVSGCMFQAAVCLVLPATSQVLESQLSQEIYHCLKHLTVNAKTGELEIVRRHGVEQWAEQIAFTDGDGYLEDAPNLFDKRIYPGAAATSDDDNAEAIQEAQI